MSAANKKPELPEEYRKIFIEQAPTAIAMLDNDMCYIAISQSWIRDYKLEGIDIIGLSHYDVFPEISDDWKAIHKKCLKGATDSCKEAPFRRADGSLQWIHWDVGPWYNTEGDIGGLLMYTGDITHHKKKEREKERIEEILEKTNDIARLGTWEFDLATNEVYWNTITSEIYEVPEGYKPNFEEAFTFFKNDQSRKKAKNAVKNAIRHSAHFDIELELTTAKGNTRWVRVVGKPEFVNKKSWRLFGIIQDLSKLKISEQALNRAHAELKAIFNSKFISIISTNSDGIINNFNRGAESLLGYSASEIVGLKRPSIYLVAEDTLRFRNDLAKRYDKDPSTFDHYVDLSDQNFNDTREWTYRRKDGSTLPVLSTLSAINDTNGRIEGFVAVATDISEIKKAQTELLKKNQLLNFAEQITLMGHWQWDTVGDKVTWSQNLYKIFELDKERVDLKFDTYFGFVHPEDKEMVTNYFDRAANDKRFYKFTHRILTTSGKLKSIQLLGKVITDVEGEITEMIGTCQDVTEIKRAQAELLKKNQLLTFAEQITAMGNWQWNTVTNSVKWSNNLYTIFDLDPKNTALTYETYFDFVHPDDKDFVTNHVQEAIRLKKFDSLVHRIKLKNGVVKTIQLLSKIITNEEDEVVELIGTCQDVTEQKMAEKKFKGLLESAPDAMIIVNKKGKIQLINKQSEKLFGYTPEELFDKPVEILIPTRFSPKHTKHRESFFTIPNTREMGEGRELYGLNKNGEEIPIQISLSPLHTEEGLLVSAAIRDITKQKLAEQKLIEAKESLEVIAQKLSKQNRQLADFTHITSHNLRAPVSNLNSLLEIYNYTENEEEREDLFSKFKTVIQHLTLTLDTLVDALKTKISDSSEDLENITLDDILNNTKEILSGKILKSGAIIRSDFSKVPNIRYNKIYLESIFLNLVGNSIKYKSEARSPEIFITSAIKNGEIILKFKDNGLGIDMEKHGHKLFGLNKVFHRHPEAKGVGLFLTKTQIEAMGGVISASSKVNVGTTFTINFN